MDAALRVVKNSLALLGGQFYGVVVNLATIAIIARYLPVDVFGDYGFILAYCTIFMVLTDMGGNRIAIREIARDHESAAEIFAATLLLKCLLSVVTFASIVLIVAASSDSPQVLSATYLAALGVVVFFIGDISGVIFMAFERMEYNAILQIATETVYLLAVVAVVSTDLGLNGIFLASLLAYAVRLVFGLSLVSRNFFRPRFVWDSQKFLWILWEALPIGVNRLLRKASFRIDTIILQALRTREDVGLFHGAYRIVLVTLFIPRLITDALYPLFSRFGQESEAERNALFERSFKFLLVMVLPLTLSVVLLADPIVHLILGKKFQQAGPVLGTLSLLWAVTFFSVLCNKVLTASDRQRLATVAVGICLVVNTSFDLVLIPRFGPQGAAYATLAGEATLFLASFYFLASRRIYTGSIFPVVWRPLLAFGAALGPAAVEMAPGVAVGASLLVYALLLYALGVFGPEDAEVFLAVKQRVGKRLARRAARTA